MDDRTLLEQFIDHASKEALNELVRRHIDMVYSAALRQTGEHGLAEDVTQLVFVLLAHKGWMIRRGEALAGWLLAATRTTALNALRARSRRRKYEREAAAMKSEIQSDQVPAWESVGPLLDEAVTGLRREDRDAITLRYFKGQSVSDVAAALGVSESAAQKRVSRALGRLRGFFARKGVAASEQGLASALALHVVSAAPERLLAQIVQQASTLSIATKGAVLMATAKTKLAVAACVAIVLAGASAPVVYRRLHSTGSASAPNTIATPAAAAASARDALAAIYALAPGEDLKRFQPPFPPERRAFYETLDKQEYGTRPPDAWTFKWTGGGFADDGGVRIGSPHDVSDALSSIVGIWPQDTDIPSDILNKVIPGDWVVRAGASKAQLADSFARAIPDALGPDKTLRLEPVQREVIVVRGSINYVPLPDATEDERQSHVLRISRTEPQNGRTPKGRGQNTTLVINTLGQILRWPIVLENPLDDGALRGWTLDLSADFRKTDPADSTAVDEVLANVMNQTGLDMKRERRTVQLWRVVNRSQADFDRGYRLTPAQNVKRIQPPFIAERAQFFGELRGAMNVLPQSAVFVQTQGRIGMRIAMRDTMNFGDVLKYVVDIWPQDAELSRHLLALPVPGDWMVREGATQQQRIIELFPAIEEIVGDGMTFKLEPLEREAIVVSGALRFDRTQKPPGNMISFAETGPRTEQMLTVAQTPREMLQKLGEMMARPIVIETEVDQEKQSYSIKTFKSADFSRAAELPDGATVDAILQHVADQTSLQLRREKRIVPTWRLVRQP